MAGRRPQSDAFSAQSPETQMALLKQTMDDLNDLVIDFRNEVRQNAQLYATREQLAVVTTAQAKVNEELVMAVTTVKKRLDKVFERAGLIGIPILGAIALGLLKLLGLKI